MEDHQAQSMEIMRNSNIGNQVNISYLKKNTTDSFNGFGNINENHDEMDI